MYSKQCKKPQVQKNSPSTWFLSKLLRLKHLYGLSSSLFLCFYVSLFLDLFVSMFLCFHVSVSMFLCTLVSLFLCFFVPWFHCFNVSLFLYFFVYLSLFYFGLFVSLLAEVHIFACLTCTDGLVDRYVGYVGARALPYTLPCIIGN